MGTLLDCLFSGGLWLLATPFYPVSRINCGTEEGGHLPEEPAGAPFQESLLCKRRRFKN